MSKSTSSPAEQLPFIAPRPPRSSSSSTSSSSSLSSDAASSSSPSSSSPSSTTSSAGYLSSTLSSTISSISSSVTSFFRTPPLPTHPTPIPYYTPSEVALHNSASSFWAIVHGRVYDLTHYLPLHPGGHRLLFQWGGKDCTGDFVGVRHSKRAVSILDKYWIGDVVGTKPMRVVPVGLGSLVKGGMLGEGLPGTKVGGLSGADVMKLQSRVSLIHTQRLCRCVLVGGSC